MDPFSKLPAVVQAELFHHVESEASIMRLVRASPAMASLFVSCKTSILQHILMSLLAGDTNGHIFQDALAILHFPYADGASSIPLIHHHIELWVTQAFKDPFRQPNHTTIQSLWRLFQRLIMFIEDYLAKATDPFPPRAYMAIPGITFCGPWFKGNRIDVKPVMFTTLTHSEKICFLRAFLRYELLCKIYHPRVWPFIKKTSCASQVQFMHEKLRTVEYKELYCVHEYFRGVYGAIFAHCQDSWLPDRPTPCSSSKQQLSSKNGLLHPDTVYFSAGAYCWDMNIRCENLVDILPCLGLDLLVHALASLEKQGEYGQYLKRWFHNLSKGLTRSYNPWISKRHFSKHHALSTTYEPNIYHWGPRQKSSHRPTKGPVFLRNSEWNRKREHEQRVHLLRMHDLQLRIYRQRAWAFFENTRLYPDARSHFPTMDYLDEQDRIAGTRLAPDIVRSQRRSQKWQDYYWGRTLDNPLYAEEEEDEEEVILEDKEGNLKRFFEKPVSGEIVTF